MTDCALPKHSPTGYYAIYEEARTSRSGHVYAHKNYYPVIGIADGVGMILDENGNSVPCDSLDEEMFGAFLYVTFELPDED
jgi:hypothetical protein